LLRIKGLRSAKFPRIEKTQNKMIFKRRGPLVFLPKRPKNRLFLPPVRFLERGHECVQQWLAPFPLWKPRPQYRRNAVLKEETVEILGRGCAVSMRAEGNAVSFVSILPCCLEIPLGAFLKKDIMLATLSKHGRQPTARS
jgi:hypothetical protein